MRRTVVTAVVAALAATAGLAGFLARPAGAIANGSAVPAGSYGFAARLTFTGIPRTDGSTYDSACSGALIGQRWVISAGHCFHDAARVPISGPLPYATSTVLVGRTDAAATGGAVRSIVSVQQAPGGADVALALLDRPVTTVPLLRLDTAPPRVGEVLRLTGWGATTATGGPSTKLLTGTVTVSTVAAATAGVVGRAPAATTSACAYDSGAPYFRQTSFGPALVTVESGGPACPHSSAETTYRTDVLYRWIYGHLVTGR